MEVQGYGYNLIELAEDYLALQFEDERDAFIDSLPSHVRETVGPNIDEIAGYISRRRIGIPKL